KLESLEQASRHSQYPQTCPSPHPESVNQLQAGKERIDSLAAKRAEIDEQIERAKETRLTKAQRRDKEWRENYPVPPSQGPSLYKQLANITIDIDFNEQSDGKVKEFRGQALV